MNWIVRSGTRTDRSSCSQGSANCSSCLILIKKKLVLSEWRPRKQNKLPEPGLSPLPKGSGDFLSMLFMLAAPNCSCKDQCDGLLGPNWPMSMQEHHSRQVCTPCSAIHRRTSSTLHTVTRGESLTGAGNVPASTRRHRVDFEIGIKLNTCGCRIKPVSGSVTLAESVVGMIKPFIGTCRMKKMTRSVAATLGQVRIAGRELKAR